MSADIKIQQLFAENMFNDFQTKRFGLKNCKATYDINYLYDLKELYKVTKEAEACTPTEPLSCCKHCVIVEKINTL